MGTATTTSAGHARPAAREYVWNWGLILVIMTCLMFWAAVIVGIILL